MRRIATVFATGLGLILLLTMPSLAQPAQAETGLLEGGGCRAAYNSGGFKNTYPCISVSGGYFRADAYTAGLPASCAYYVVYVVAITPTYPATGGQVEAWSSRQPCNRWHSDTVLFRDENTLWTYVSRITVFNNSGGKVGSLESPRVWT